MKLAESYMIKKIDEYAELNSGASTVELMQRAGIAVARAVRELVPTGADVVILAGCGNNGGDGYALALELASDYAVTVLTVTDRQSRGPAAFYKEKYTEKYGAPVDYRICTDKIADSDCIVDAIFGTGFHGELGAELISLAGIISSSRAVKIAIDIPLGIDADTAEVNPIAPRMDATVALSYLKPCHVSYPAADYVGKLYLDTLGINNEEIEKSFAFRYELIDKAWAKSNLPEREKNSNKGSFGKLLIVTGSDKYRGAAHLSLHAALRGGAGYVSFLGTDELCTELRPNYPEAIYVGGYDIDAQDEEQTERIKKLSAQCRATLIGSGSGNTSGLLNLVKELISSEGGTLILDADALNAISTNPAVLKSKKRELILTPHPLEFARLLGVNPDTVQQKRIPLAEKFAEEYGVTLVLKGAATVITDGKNTYINSSGSSALAKAGSGDVLAGLITSLSANMPQLKAAALGCYLHGAAGDECSKRFSEYGVRVFDLPIKIAEILAEIEKSK